MTTPRTRPASVTLAFVLFLLQLLVAIGGLVVAVVVEQSQRTDQSLGAGPIWNGAVSLVVPLLELVVVFKMRAGRNWARIVVTILAILSIALSALVVLAGVAALARGDDGGGGTLQLALVAVRLVVTVVALVAMYTRSANAYFRRT